MKKLITLLSLNLLTSAFAYDFNLSLKPERLRLPENNVIEAVESVKFCPTQFNLYMASNLNEQGTDAELVSSRPTVSLVDYTIVKGYVYCYYGTTNTNAINKLKVRLKCENAEPLADGSNSGYDVNHVFSCVDYIVKKPSK